MELHAGLEVCSSAMGSSALRDGGVSDPRESLSADASQPSAQSDLPAAESQNSREPAQMASESSDDLGDDENICRICRTGAEEDRPLFFPCMCNGSIRYAMVSSL